MKTAIGKAIPVTKKNRQKMTERIGREFFEFDTLPTPDLVLSQERLIDSLRWESNQLDDDLIAFMRKTVIEKFGSDERLNKGIYFVTADLELVMYD